MEDLTVRRLTKKVFPYIWRRHKLISCNPPMPIYPFSEMTVFSQVVGNAVIVYLHMYRPTLSKYLEKHIPSMPQSKMHFWTHVAFLCIQVRLASDKVFDYFLTTCSITAEVALHCHMHGYEDVLPYASVFFCAFFETELYEDFHEAGGWVGLHQYIKDSSCPELYEEVNGYIQEISSPSEHLPILITIQREALAAERREKFSSLRSFKIGEIEREDKTELLVSGIFHWDFMENQRISEVRPGILKRMENIRHKKNKLNIYMVEERRDESSESDEALDTDKHLCLFDEAETSDSTATMFETPSNFKDGQTNKDLKCTEVRKENQQCTSNETSGKVELGSSSRLRELCNYYESLSEPNVVTMNDSKRFKSKDGTQNGLKPSAIKCPMANTCEKVGHFESPQKFVPCAGENGGAFPKSENFTAETVVKSTESFNADALSELTKSFQELGFNCLCVGNSSPLDEKSDTFTNYAEIMEKCRYFQSKYPSLQFAILLPNDYFTEKKSHAPATEDCDELRFERQYNGQEFPSITKKDFENCTVSPQKLHSETEKSNFFDTKVDENQFGLTNGRALQNSAIQSIQKSDEENDLMSRGETFKISRFSVTKVNEGQIISRNETSLSEDVCTIEPTTVSRFKVSKVNENQSKDQITDHKNRTSDTTKISRFTVSKINENEANDQRIDHKNLTSDTTKISRFTVSKINENKENYDHKNLIRDPTKISRFSVTKVDGGQSRLSEGNYSISETSDDPENAAIQFQDSGSVKYQKRVSFAELPSIAYYQPYYSSEESPNSRTSQESLNQNSPSPKESVQNANQEDTPTLRNIAVSGGRQLFRRHSYSDSRASNNNSRSSNASLRFSFLGRLLRRSNSRNAKVNESEEIL